MQRVMRGLYLGFTLGFTRAFIEKSLSKSLSLLRQWIAGSTGLITKVSPGRSIAPEGLTEWVYKLRYAPRGAGAAPNTRIPSGDYS
jgi:hypothetical protein